MILAATFFYMCSSMLVTPLIASFAKNISGSNVLAGFIAGLTNLVSLGLRPLAGSFSDRFSKYALAFFGGTFLLLANLGYALAVTTWQLILFRVLNGVGYVFSSVCMASWMVALLPRTKIGSGMGLFGLLNALGMALGPAAGIILYHLFGYRAAFLIAALSSILMISLIQLIGNHALPLQPRQPVLSFKNFHLFQKQVIPIAVILLLFSLPYFATQTYLVSYIEQQHFAVPAAAFFPIYAVILLLLRLTLKNLFDTVKFGVWLWIGLLSNTTALLALYHLTNIFWMLLAALGLAGGYGLMFSICQATAFLVAPVSERGLASNTFYIGIDLGMTLGPITGGLLEEFLPLRWFYPALLLTIPLSVIIYLIDRQKLNSVLHT